MYPDRPPANDGKKYWSNKDCFSDNAQNSIRAFLHKDYSIGMHSHEFYEINIVLSGRGCHYIEDKKLEVTAGDVFVIPSEIRHAYISGDKLDVFHFLVRCDFLSKYKEELEGTKGYKMLFDIEPYLRQSTGENYFLHYDGEELYLLKNEIKKIHSAQQEGNDVYMSVLTLAFFLNLCIRMHENITSKSGKSSDADVLRVLDYINNNFSEKITVDEMAKLVNMSKSTFNRHFKRAVGTTPMEYVISCRAKRAKELMREKTYTKAEIAQLCGFYDSSHMSKNICPFVIYEEC